MSEIIEKIKSVNKIALLFSILMVSRALGFLPSKIPSAIEYTGVISMSLFCFYKQTHIEKIYIILFIYFLLNIFLLDINPMFQPWSRYIYFITLLLCVSPTLQSEYLRKVRHDILFITLSACIILSTLTFFCWFLGVNFMKAQYLDITKAGSYSGLFNHSMVMGPVAGVSSLVLFYKFFKGGNWLYLLLALICIGSMFFSASRTAFVCTLSSLFIIIIIIKTDKYKFRRNLLLITVGLIISYPLWKDVTSMMIEKQTNNIDSGSTFASRESVWNARIEEFKSSPAFGIGFCSVDPSRSMFSEGGTIEPGSSWLAILSMTGIIGFIITTTIFVKSFYYSIRNGGDNSLLTGLLLFFFLHMITEGYIFSGGSFLCFFLWIIVGCCFDKKYEIIDEE